MATEEQDASSLELSAARVANDGNACAFQTQPSTDKAAAELRPLLSFDEEIYRRHFPQSTSGRSRVPAQPPAYKGEYLAPTLASQEQLRLRTLWYHIRGLHDDSAAMDSVRAKVAITKEIIGWEYAICGIVDCDHFERIAAAGLPLSTMPRRESPCSHTVLQPPGSVLFLPDMARDWRFEAAPCVTSMGLGAYAGAPIRVRTRDDAEEIALGSLCIASDTSQQLEDKQLAILTKFADMISKDIITASRFRRMKQQEYNDSLLKDAVEQLLVDLSEESVLTMLKKAFPTAAVSLESAYDGTLALMAHAKSLPHFSNVQCRVWEDVAYIDHYILTNNHNAEGKLAPRPIRALLGNVQDDPAGRILVVSTCDVSHIFDDVDERFVSSCALLLSNIFKDHSLRDALQAREHFMRGVTHHLRTPIHGILASVELLQIEFARMAMADRSSRLQISGHSNEALINGMHMIGDSGKELMRFVNSMIRYNHWIEPSVLSTPVSIIDLNSVEAQILQGIPEALIEARLGHACVYFHRGTPERLALVMRDQSLIEDCLQPLVLNAVQNTFHGSIVISYFASEDFSSITFDIEDTGRGIPVADQQRIFESYEKGDDVRQGSGLGLTLARKVAETSGGSLHLVSSEPGKGSHFRITICNQTFACPLEPQKYSLHSKFEALPQRFNLVHDDPKHHYLQRFAESLESHGLEATDSLTNALALIPYTHEADEYKNRLNKATGAFLAFSLVPNQYDTTEVKAAHPDILFFRCPFTTPRCNEILNIVDDTCQALRTHAIDSVDQSPQSPLSPDQVTSPYEEAEDAISLSQQVKMPRCLLVDDNPINLRILCMFCAQRGFPYTEAYDGLEAIDRYKDGIPADPVELILLDLQMPKCDGIEACRVIREYEKSHCIQPSVVIMITGQDNAADRRSAENAGADAYFVKPLAMKRLQKVISGYFDMNQQQSQLPVRPRMVH